MEKFPGFIYILPWTPTFKMTYRWKTSWSIKIWHRFSKQFHSKKRLHYSSLFIHAVNAFRAETILLYGYGILICVIILVPFLKLIILPNQKEIYFNKLNIWYQCCFIDMHYKIRDPPFKEGFHTGERGRLQWGILSGSKAQYIEINIGTKHKE